MKRGLLIVIFLILPSVLAQYYQAEQLLLDVEISNTLTIVPKRTDYDLKRATVYLSFYPREDFRQDIEDLVATPKKTNADDTYIFEWTNPVEDELEFKLDSRIRTHNSLIKINKKVDFPISQLTDELEAFIIETPTIDYTDKRIMNLASELAYGEDDLYVMVHKIADWVNKNINYNLNTKTADASQKASWVIDNSEGVCDELTNLFIGVCRALGIPARFVSGLSYTDLESFPDKWSPHGWAEVYFPGYGWIPFDVTYGEFGYIDPAHIKLKDALDANRSSTRYEWEGYYVGMDTGRLNMKTTVIDVIGKHTPFVEVESELLKDRTGFESYNAVEVTVTNPHAYYVPTELSLSRSEGIEVFEDYHRFVLMPPNSAKKEFWIFKLNQGQDSRYIYNYTFNSYTIRNASSIVNLLSTNGYKTYSLRDIRDLVEKGTEEEQKTYSKNVEMQCEAESIYYVGQTAKITCELRNTGNVVLEDLNICIGEACKPADLPIGQKQTFVFPQQLTISGPHDILVTAKNHEVTKTTNIQFDVWDRPDVTISELTYPAQIGLSEKFKIEFKLSPATSSVPHNLKAQLVCSSFEKEWTLDELSRDRKYVLNVDSYSLSEKENDFKILVNYEDKMGRKFSNKEEFHVSLSNVSLKERFILILNKINVELKYDFVIIAIALFVAGIVVGLIFRSRRRY